MEGFLLIQKPTGITSFGCIKRLKKVFAKKIKIGHGGTLDGFASGLLIIGISRAATRYMNVLLKIDKQYHVTGKLGATTQTFDSTQPIMQRCPTTHLTQRMLEQSISDFVGEYEQIPPIVSALKYKGERLSDLLRSGAMSHTELAVLTGHKKRIVTIYSLALFSFYRDTFVISAHVSHGTYIRVLIADIGQSVGSCAYTTSLSRIAIGPFLLSGAVALESIHSQEDIQKSLLSIECFLNKVRAYRSES